MVKSFVRFVGVLALVGVASLRAEPPQGPAPTTASGARANATAAATAPSASAVKPVVDKYCVGCHNQRAKASYANLALDNLDLGNPGAHADTLEKVVAKLRARTMPPAAASRPDEATYATLIATIETALDGVATVTPNPGRPVLHRLNRTEYVNAIRDLLALEIDGPTYLPADNSGFGFDNIGDVLSISPALLDRYMSTGRKISRLAIGDANIRPVSTFYKVPTLLLQDDRRNDDLPFGSRGGLAVRHTFPLDGEYAVRVDFTKDYGDQWRGRHEDSVGDVRLDGQRVKQFTLEKSTRNTSIMAGDGQRPNSGPLEVRFSTTAGAHTVAVAFNKRAVVTEGVGPDRLPVGSTSFGQLGTTSVANGRIESGVQNIEIVGPYNALAPAHTASRQQVFTCRPTSAQTEEACARTILSKLARRAYRRPPTSAEVQTLMTFYKEGRASGDFDTGIGLALERILIAPAFLFRSEQETTSTSGRGVQPVSDIDLASRLSFFLWSSIPDEELLGLAERGRLHDPGVLERQTRRMLADARAEALVSNFFGQWLMLRNVESQLPDYLIYPEFDDSLREAFRRETELFLQSQVRADRSALDLLTADYTFVNERLARHYGIPNVYGSHFRRVTYPDQKRAGLLGHGSVLLVTAYPDRTSPVFRGKWLLENILGTPPPMPPANVPPFPENDPKSAPKSVRARMEMHRKNPVCASCHTQLDPLGFGLENFDGIGRWRDVDANAPVDASGQFPNGLKFADAAAFRQGLLTGYRTEFLSTMTKKLTTYALGRGVESTDMPAVRKIVRDAEANDYHWSSLILGIVKSMPFQMRRSDS